MRKFIIISLIAVIVPFMAFASEGGHKSEKYKGAHGMKFSPAQQEAMRQIGYKMKRFMIKHHSKMKLVRLDLKEELEKIKPDKNKLQKLVSELAELQKVHEQKRLGALLELTGTMTREERIKFLSSKKGKMLLGGKKKGGGGHKGH